MKPSYINGIGIFAGISGALIAAPAQADINIPENIAQKESIPISIVPGKSTSINFKNDERISYLILGDRSKIVYSLNAPTETGEARSIFLRNIEGLDFPGETTSANPNLQVVALNSEGEQINYEFVVDNSQEYDSKINITPAKKKKKAPKKPKNVVNTELGEATPADIRIGLKYKLRKGEISPDDPITLTTSEAIAQTLNGDKTLLAIAEEWEIPLSVLSEFGKSGLAQKAKFRIKSANKKKANALKKARSSLIENKLNTVQVDTDLGKASLKDIKFGLSVMKKRESVAPEKLERISELINSIKNGQSISAADQEELKDVGRLGLAFDARRRILGTIN